MGGHGEVEKRVSVNYAIADAAQAVDRKLHRNGDVNTSQASPFLCKFFLSIYKVVVFRYS